VLGRCVDEFFGGFQVVAPYNDTCVDTYSIVNGSYTLEHSAYMHQFQVSDIIYS